VKLFSDLNKTAAKGAIVLVGDSITEGFRIGEMTGRDIMVYNRGINGDTTEGLLEHMAESCFGLSPAKIFLLIGTNDLGNGVEPAVVAGNIETMLTLIQEQIPATQVHVLSLLPVNAAASPEARQMVGIRTRDKILETNMLLSRLAEQYGAVYISLFESLADDTGDLRPDFTPDGLHLSVAGYSVLLDGIRPYLQLPEGK
jgi:lysophospholipase L1-like esterase